MSYQLYLGDCLDILPAILDKSVDVAITDPPYGIKITKNAKKYGDAAYRSRQASMDNWDDTAPNQKAFAEIFRVSKNQIVFGANYFWHYFRATSCYIVWNKRGNMPKVPFADVEFAWTSFDRTPKNYTVVNHGFIRDSKEPRYHPTQKPLLLIRMIVEEFTKPGNTILDPFMGSGTTGVACIETGRNFIGIEKEPKYYEIAQQRLAMAGVQPALLNEQ